jgi:hypothetical protein
MSEALSCFQLCDQAEEPITMTNHPNRTPRHGHLPGHIRDAFEQAIDAYIDSEPGAPPPLA